MPAIEKLLQTRASADVQRSNALWRIKLVPGEGKQIQAQRVDIDGNLPGGLHCIGMKVDVGIRRDAPNFFERLRRAQLVVGVHHGNQHGFLAKSAAQRLWRNDSLPVDGQVGDRYTLLLKRLARVEHSFVLDAGADDVFGVSDGKALTEITDGVWTSTRRPAYQRENHAKHHIVARFRAAHGDDDSLTTPPNH